jgi:putative ABC transport system permease protein
MASQRFPMILLSAFAILALLLATVGIYGVISYSTTQRVREIGIRMALGATPGGVLRLLLAHGLRISLAGVGLGLAAAWAMGRALARLLTEVKPADSLVLTGAAAILLAVGLLASYLPAHRAARADPMTALKQE